MNKSLVEFVHCMSNPQYVQGLLLSVYKYQVDIYIPRVVILAHISVQACKRC